MQTHIADMCFSVETSGGWEAVDARTLIAAARRRLSELEADLATAAEAFGLVEADVFGEECEDVAP